MIIQVICTSPLHKGDRTFEHSVRTKNNSKKVCFECQREMGRERTRKNYKYIKVKDRPVDKSV